MSIDILFYKTWSHTTDVVLNDAPDEEGHCVATINGVLFLNANIIAIPTDVVANYSQIDSNIVLSCDISSIAQPSENLVNINGSVKLFPDFEYEYVYYEVFGNVNGGVACLSNINAEYDSNTDRPFVGECVSTYQLCYNSNVGTEDTSHNGIDLEKDFICDFQKPEQQINIIYFWLRKTLQKLRGGVDATYEEVANVQTGLLSDWYDLVRVRYEGVSAFQKCDFARDLFYTKSGVGETIKKQIYSQHSVATSNRIYLIDASHYPIRAFSLNCHYWQIGTQPNGLIVVIIIPPRPPIVEPCFDPSPDIIFFDRFTITNDLLLTCDDVFKVFVIPRRKVYEMRNEIIILRKSDLTEIPAYSVQISLDTNSWVYGFSALVPARDAKQKLNNNPTELVIKINNKNWNMLAEKITYNRSFTTNNANVEGRGINALLSEPYSPEKVFVFNTDKTIKQIVDGILTENNVPIGWDVVWVYSDNSIDDYIVPGGSYSFTGTYASAISDVATAIGAYIVPDDVLQKMYIKPLYIKPIWQISDSDVQIVLPEDIVVEESVSLEKRPDYNRVYVVGQQNGVIVEVTRSGTSGNILAPLFTHPLITSVVGGRLKGTEILSASGEKKYYDLRFPPVENVFLNVGDIIRYTLSDIYVIGIVRGVSISATLNEVWQQVRVEVVKEVPL